MILVFVHPKLVCLLYLILFSTISFHDKYLITIRSCAICIHVEKKINFTITNHVSHQENGFNVVEFEESVAKAKRHVMNDFDSLSLATMNKSAGLYQIAMSSFIVTTISSKRKRKRRRTV
jgi:hypothetical protein